MLYGMYQMRDTKSGYLAPTLDINDAVAIRNFDTMIRKTDDVIHFHKEDFILYKFGEYDSETGVCKLFAQKEIICEGCDLGA